MTEKKVKVPLGDIPARTSADFYFDPDTGLHVSLPVYRCLDCRYTTRLLEEMKQHQQHPDLRHRLKRNLWV